MFEIFKNIPKDSKVILVSIDKDLAKIKRPDNDFLDSAQSLDELESLVHTLGLKVHSKHIQKIKKVSPATILGEGKIKELAEEAKNNDVTALIFDLDLKPGQLKNVEKLTNLPIFDRYHVILEIFSEHAHTVEAKKQIEITKLKYVLPRLTLLWSHLSKQRGGIGVRGGEGEQQIELDRRLVKDRISKLKEDLEKIKISQKERNKKRLKNTLTAALVGYTNAGKSSLLNLLCKDHVLEQDALFSTLDTTYRKLNPNSNPPMVLSDTVGIISNLPTGLVQGFRSTLESVKEADLVLVVCDLSDMLYEKQLQVAQKFLEEIGLPEDQDQIFVFTKKDQVENSLLIKIIQKTYPGCYVVSKFDSDSILNLKRGIVNSLISKQNMLDLFVPYEDSAVHAQIAENSRIVSRINHQAGMFYRIQTKQEIIDQLNLKRYQLAPHTDHPIDLF